MWREQRVRTHVHWTLCIAVAMSSPLTTSVEGQNVSGCHRWTRLCSSDTLDTSHRRLNAWCSTVWTGHTSISGIASVTVADMEWRAHKCWTSRSSQRATEFGNHCSGAAVACSSLARAALQEFSLDITIASTSRVVTSWLTCRQIWQRCWRW